MQAACRPGGESRGFSFAGWASCLAGFAANGSALVQGVCLGVGGGRRRRRPGSRFCQVAVAPPLSRQSKQACLAMAGLTLLQVQAVEDWWAGGVQAACGCCKLARAQHGPTCACAPKSPHQHGLQQPCKASARERLASEASTDKRGAKLLGGMGGASFVCVMQGRAPTWWHPFRCQVLTSPSQACLLQGLLLLPNCTHARR